MALCRTCSCVHIEHITLRVQARKPPSDSNYWSLIQLLLILATLAAVLLVPSLMALVPNFNGHILPSAPHKVRHSKLHAAGHASVPAQAHCADCEVRCMPGRASAVCCEAFACSWLLRKRGIIMSVLKIGKVMMAGVTVPGQASDILSGCASTRAPVDTCSEADVEARRGAGQALQQHAEQHLAPGWSG